MTKLLYVEDEIFLGKIVKESLESRGYSVLMISDGNKVISSFKQYIPDVCVLDIMLPNKDGFTISQEIRDIEKNVPIIFVTAKTQTEDLVKGFKNGGNDYIRKPFSIEELIVRIENVLKNGGGKNPVNLNDKIIMGDYIFNPNYQTLSFQQEEKKLSFRESELLKILYHNHERIIDRKEILNLLWGSDNFFNSRNLDVYITKIRGYLKQDPSLEILTIKGVGYRFIIK